MLFLPITTIIIIDSAAQEFLRILSNPKVHYHVHRSFPSIPTLSQINPVSTTPTYPFKTNFNIIHPPTSSSFQWSPSS
jgi:hypothetical protein